MSLIFPLQQEVASSVGFTGDEGYVKMQIMLMLHAHDDSVAYNTLAGTMAIFRRAGIQAQ